MKRYPMTCSAALLSAAATVLMIHVSEGASVYLQNFDTFDDVENNHIYFDADADYDGIGGTLVGAKTSAPNANVNGLLDNATSGIPAAHSGSYFLYSATGGLDLEAGVVWSTNASQMVSVTVGTVYEFAFWMAGNSTTNPAEIIPFINGVGLQNVVVDGIENPGIASYSATGWTKHTYRWLADTDTADLGLFSANTETTGNDFGLDTIELHSVVPEPGAALMLCAAGVLLLLDRRRIR